MNWNSLCAACILPHPGARCGGGLVAREAYIIPEYPFTSAAERHACEWGEERAGD